MPMLLRGPAEHFEEAVGGNRRAALGQEDVARSRRLLALDPSQCADLEPAERLHAVITALAAEHLQPAGFEIHLLPA
jgi:hypothetical protein